MMNNRGSTSKRKVTGREGMEGGRKKRIGGRVERRKRMDRGNGRRREGREGL